MAAGEGFEPSQTESESGVLPLHKPAIVRSPLTISQAHILLYAESRKCQEKFCVFQKNLSAFSINLQARGDRPAGPANISGAGLSEGPLPEVRA